MVQISLFDSKLPERVVNVASVPQRSPFRYPGGKTWLVPRVRQWVASLGKKPHHLIEPFAGGAIVGLTAAFEQLAGRVTLVERDEDVAAVWQLIIREGEGRWLAERIRSFRIAVDSIQEELSQERKDLRGRAFQTLLRNRVYHGGILAPGSGLIKHGENGKGIGSRWYPETLIKRILNIDAIRHRIDFIEGDGLTVLESYKTEAGSVFFIDPPYTASKKRAGRRLYKYNELDHKKLFSLANEIEGDFLMTYDHATEIYELAAQHGFDSLTIFMQNTHLTKMEELLIGKNLGWAR